MTDKEKLSLLNSMKHEEASSCGDELEYVLVKDSENNRNILHKIGFNNEEINYYCNPEEGLLDISGIAFEKLNADYYDHASMLFKKSELKKLFENLKIFMSNEFWEEILECFVCDYHIETIGELNDLIEEEMSCWDD